MKKLILAIAVICFLSPGMAFAENKVWEHTIFSGNIIPPVPKTKFKFKGLKVFMTCKYKKGRVYVWIKAPKNINKKAKDCAVISAATALAVSPLTALAATQKAFLASFAVCAGSHVKDIKYGLKGKFKWDKTWRKC